MAFENIEIGDVPQGAEGAGVERERLLDAIDNASDQDRATWVLYHGKRIAAIVPVSDAESLPAWRFS